MNRWEEDGVEEEIKEKVGEEEDQKSLIIVDMRNCDFIYALNGKKMLCFSTKVTSTSPFFGQTIKTLSGFVNEESQNHYSLSSSKPTRYFIDICMYGTQLIAHRVTVKISESEKILVWTLVTQNQAREKECKNTSGEV